MKNINTSVIMLGIVSIAELYLTHQMEYTLFLWVFYGIWRIIKLVTTGK
ncbi:MAG: hypothetical protein ACOC2W_02945 [bacterium]